MDSKKKKILLYSAIGIGAAAGLAGLYLILTQKKYSPVNVISKDDIGKQITMSEERNSSHIVPSIFDKLNKS